jgi:branched-chain amino acid transport system substrate-binding protein
MVGVSEGSDKVSEVKVGVIVPLSGSLSSIGTAAKRGAMLAAEHINNEGGIKAMGGAKIKLSFGDDEAKPNVGMAEAERLIKQEKIDALIGAYTSSVSFPMTQVAERYKVPVVVPASAKDEITERGFKYTFRLCDKASGYSKGGLSFLKWLYESNNIPLKTIGLLYEDSGWGKAYSNSLKSHLQKSDYGFEIVADLPYSKDTKDMRATILKLKAANPDALVQVSYTVDAILAIKTMHELGYYPKALITGGSGHTVPDFYKSVGKLSEYIYVTEPFSPMLPVGEVKERAAEFQKKYNTPMDMYGAFFYTATYVLADALEKAGSVDKDEVRKALTKVNIEVGKKGNLFPYAATFDEQGQAPATTSFCQWKKGVKEIVYPTATATAKAVIPAPAWNER